MKTKTTRIKYDHLVVAIPHAHPDAGVWQRESDKKAKAFRDRFTDWYTDELFDVKSDSISVVKGDISRLDCDLERLEHETDRLCNFLNVGSGNAGHLLSNSAYRNYYLSKWFRYRADILEASSTSMPLIIDSHSFPSDLAPDIDICIGFNDDASCPPENVLNTVRKIFENAGYSVAFNKPYANAIAPIGYIGHSLMIEVNKKLYMDEMSLQKNEGFTRLHVSILNVYCELLRRDF